MKKILDYIVNGKGWGFRFVLAIAFILTLIVSFYVKQATFAAIPQVQSFAEQVLPMRIENGIIVEPVDMVKTIPVLTQNEDGADLAVTLDTTVNEFDIKSLKQGVYVSKTAVYSVNGADVRIQKFEGNHYFPKDDYTPLFEKIATWAIVAFLPLMLIVASLMFFFMVMFYTIFAAIISAIFKKNFDFSFKMRLTSIAFSITYVLFFLIGFAGFSNRLLFFVAVLALQTIIIKEVPAPKNKD